MGKLKFIGLVALEVALIPIKIPAMMIVMILFLYHAIRYKVKGISSFRESWDAFCYGFTTTLKEAFQWYGDLWRTGEFE